MTTRKQSTTTQGKATAKPSTHRYLTEGYRPTVHVPTPKKVPKLVSGVTTASSSHGK